jgi:hypothetical protein
MRHYFSTLLDDDCLRCEACGVNPLSAKAKENCPDKF